MRFLWALLTLLLQVVPGAIGLARAQRLRKNDIVFNSRGIPLAGLTTVNLDFARQYRPQTNVVTRPASAGARGYSLVGHHEIMIPLLAAAIIEQDEAEGRR